MSETIIQDSTTTPSAAPVSTEHTTQTPVTLPEGYLRGGYHDTTESGAKFLKSEYIEKYAQTLAASFKGMKTSEFEKLVRELKKSKKRTLPYEARRTAAAELLPAAKNLIRHKKAPAILAAFIQANLEAIKDDETWTAFLRHCQVIVGYMD